jgi:hypothetical protein
VRGTEGCCWNTVPDRIVPERGQVSENCAPEASRRLRWGRRHAENVGDILDEAVARSKVANDSAHLVPQNGLGVPEALTLACGANPSTGEASGDEIDSAGRPRSNCPDIVIDGNAGPACFEDAASKLVLLTEPGVLPSGEGESVIEQSDA